MSSNDDDSGYDSPALPVGATVACISEQHLAANDNKLPVLLSMAIGLEDPKRPGVIISDVSTDSRFTKKKKKH